MQEFFQRHANADAAETSGRGSGVLPAVAAAMLQHGLLRLRGGGGNGGGLGGGGGKAAVAQQAQQQQQQQQHNGKLRAGSPSTPTSLLDDATPTTSNTSSAASTCDGAGAGAPATTTKKGDKISTSVAADAAAAAAATTTAATTETIPVARAPVLAHRKSIAITYRPPGASHTYVPAALAEAHPNTPFEEVVAIVTLAAFFGLAAFLPILILGSVVGAVFFRSPAAALILALFAAAAALPAGTMNQKFRHAKVWDCWRRYFGLRGVTPEIPYLDQSKRYIVVQTPHSVFPMGTFLNAGITDVPIGGMPVDVVAVVADVLLSLPIYKHIFAMIGCHPADGKTLARLLKNNSVAINPEGVAGIFHGSSRSDRKALRGGDAASASAEALERARTERVYIAKRKGFIKHAIRAGTPLLPVHHIGASQILGFTGFPELSRRLRATVGVWWGWQGLPMPHKQDIISVVGDPIDVGPRCDAPTQEHVDAVHAKLCETLCEMFEAHKHLLGPDWAEKKMVIV